MTQCFVRDGLGCYGRSTNGVVGQLCFARDESKPPEEKHVYRRCGTPVAEDSVAAPGNLAYCATPYAAATGAHAVLILAEWAEHRELNWKQMRSAMALPLIVDGRNLLDPASMQAEGFEYVGIGRSVEPLDGL